MERTIVQIGAAFRRNKYVRAAVFRCECGVAFVTDVDRVNSGKTRSCGCYRSKVTAKRNATHGKSKSKAYRIWNQMIQRCTNPKHISYQWYGAIGVCVAPQWMKFESFIGDMGEVPSGMSIDRIDVRGPYGPDNCRWTTMKQQQRNRKNNVRLVVGGEEKTIAEWSESPGAAKQATIRKRVSLGWSHEKSVFGVK